MCETRRTVVVGEDGLEFAPVNERLHDVREALRQYEDGAINFIEFCGLVETKITQEDVDEFNSFVSPEEHLHFKEEQIEELTLP